MTVTLPRIVGEQRATELLYTGARIDGETAASIGLVDRLVREDELRSCALELAGRIAAAAPLAVRSIRATMRADLAERFRMAVDREAAEQDRLRTTHDHAEGVAAAQERRSPMFEGR